jgi:hydroxymethylpyrimidine pyrophosphatase-like HAD family hydrolase
MIVHVLACDYDGTIAEHGRVAEATATALARVRETGRKLVLVTGRLLPDLKQVCPTVEEMFDAIVAENGALLRLPARKETKILGDPVEPALVDALRRHGVGFEIGASIVESREAFSEAALAAIRETGVERTLIFNKGALMLLPGGVTKRTGLEAALEAMELSVHNVVGVGDAENDHAFLAICECAVAVADAIPALRERADYVTRGSAGRGVAELIEEHVLNDVLEIIPCLPRHQLALGEVADGTALTIPAHQTKLLIVGPSGSGKSTVTGLLFERLVEAHRSVCLLDPEGDYETLGELPGVLVLGGKGEHQLPTPEELGQLLRRPASGIALNLSAMSRTEKITYATKILPAIAAIRGRSGMPHWLIIDEAHHLFPADGSSATELLRLGRDALCLITLTAEDLAPEIRRLPNAVISTDLEAFETALQTLLHARETAVRIPRQSAGPLAPSEVAFARLDEPERSATRFRVARRKIEHRRHIRKYTEGELPPDRSFYFRGPEGAMNLRAANLTRFCELAEGVDERTWEHHRRLGEYSVWMRDNIKDPELADEVAAIEAAGGAPAEMRRQVCDAIRRRYTV